MIVMRKGKRRQVTLRFGESDKKKKERRPGKKK